MLLSKAVAPSYINVLIASIKFCYRSSVKQLGSTLFAPGHSHRNSIPFQTISNWGVVKCISTRNMSSAGSSSNFHSNTRAY